MIWSSRARNRSPSPVVSRFFGRILFSDAAPNHGSSGKGIPKTKSQDRVIPLYEDRGVPLQRVLTDRGTEYCGTHDRHEYELYLTVENIDHSRTKAKSPQTNGIAERFHKTMLDAFYRVVFRKKIYLSIDELQVDLDAWVTEYNEVRSHQGRYCFGKTPLLTFLDATPLAREKPLLDLSADQPSAA